MERSPYVYMLSSSFKHLYVGVTSDLTKRVWQHKNGTYGGFASRYRIDQLVYFERFGSMDLAIAREKQIKRWSRMKKVQLIVRVNPDWRDLSAEWGRPLERYSESGLGAER